MKMKFLRSLRYLPLKTNSISAIIKYLLNIESGVGCYTTNLFFISFDRVIINSLISFLLQVLPMTTNTIVKTPSPNS